MDLRGRIITAPGSMCDKAVMRGPIVLAMDNRLIKQDNITLWLYSEDTKWTHKDDFGGLDYVPPVSISKNNESGTYIDLKPVSNKPNHILMAFEVPFLYKPTHFFGHTVKKLILCDYAVNSGEIDPGNPEETDPGNPGQIDPPWAC